MFYVCIFYCIMYHVHCTFIFHYFTFLYIFYNKYYYKINAHVHNILFKKIGFTCCSLQHVTLQKTVHSLFMSHTVIYTMNQIVFFMTKLLSDQQMLTLSNFQSTNTHQVLSAPVPPLASASTHFKSAKRLSLP